MTEPKAQSQEPTMEEILASIRRIISENDDPSAAAAPGKAAAGQGAVAKPAAADDVLELTDMVGTDGKVVNIADAKLAASVDIPKPPATEELSPMADPTPEPAQRPKPADVSAEDVELTAPEPEPTPKPAASGNDGALVGEGAAALSTSAFAVLAHELNRKNSDDSPVTSSMPLGSGRTLEDLVKEMIRPMLRDWLDTNLPGMVERMVKREIERLVRRAED